MLLSVVIPTLNEAHRLQKTLNEILPYLRSNFPDFEIIFVDDVSTDETISIIKKYQEHEPRIRYVIQQKWLGKGASVRRGCMESKGDAILYMDADHATPIQEIEKFLPFFDSNKDSVVVGVRTRKEEESRGRRIIGLLCLLLAHIIVFRRAVPDSQCGFKLFSAKAAKKLFSMSVTNGGMIDVEIFFLMQRFQIEPKFVPVIWDNKPGSRINIVRCIFTDPIELLKIRMRGLCNLYPTQALARS